MNVVVHYLVKTQPVPPCGAVVQCAETTCVPLLFVHINFSPYRTDPEP